MNSFSSHSQVTSSRVVKGKEIAGSKECSPKLSIKGRSCNQTLLVHQDMTKKTTFSEKNSGEITQVKCKIGLWFLSSALPSH